MLGFLLSTVPVPWLVPVSRLVGNLVVLVGTVSVALGWAAIGAGLAPAGRRRRGALLGLLAYGVAGALWTVAFLLLDPWAVDYGRVDLVRFVLYSVLFWPYALAYTAGWFGLAGL